MVVSLKETKNHFVGWLRVVIQEKKQVATIVSPDIKCSEKFWKENCMGFHKIFSTYIWIVGLNGKDKVKML